MSVGFVGKLKQCMVYAGFAQGRCFKIGLEGGGGGTPSLRHFLSSSKIYSWSQFPRHWVGVSSYMTDLSDKQAREEKKRIFFSIIKGGCLDHLYPPHRVRA